MRDTSKYVVNGLRWPSVTEVLAINGLTDFSNIREDVLELARVRGNDVHEWVHGVDMGVLEGLKPDPRIAGYVDGYNRFRDEKKFEVVDVEKLVRHDTYMYVGMLDRTGLMDGEKWLLDIKCVHRVQQESALQTAAYEHALEERHNRAVLQLKPNGKYQLHPYTSRNDLHDFLSALRVAWCKIRWGRVNLDEENY
jgi:hypothetical protein